MRWRSGIFFAILARDAWGNSESEINLMFSIGSTASLGGILLGRTSARFGAWRVLAASTVGVGIRVALWGLAPLVGMFIAQASMQTAITTRESRSSVYGLISTTTGLVGGFTLAIGARLITCDGNPLPFLATSVAGMLLAATILPIKTQNPKSG